jgi:hypothetical protein
MLWVDPTDPEVFAAVAGVEADQADDDLQLVVNQAVALACEILTFATAGLIHGPGTRTEEFIGRGSKRFAPVYGPVVEVLSLVRVGSDQERAIPFRLIGNTVYVGGQAGTAGGSVPLWRINWASGAQEQVHRLTYRYASTVTAGARLILLHYAHEFFLWLTEQDDDCQLPDNVTSITREGLGIELATPQDFLDKGRTGMAKVDTWLSQVNAKRALRPSAVYTPDSPPGVGIARGGGQV